RVPHGAGGTGLVVVLLRSQRGWLRRKDIRKGSGVEAAMAGMDPRSQQFFIICRFALWAVKAVGKPLAPATQSEWSHVDHGAPHQLSHLVEVVCHPLADAQGRSTVDQDEERGTRDLVVAPSFRRHNELQALVRLRPHLRRAFELGAFGHDEQANSLREAELVRPLQRVPKTRTGGTARRQERNERQGVMARDRQSQGVTTGRDAGNSGSRYGVTFSGERRAQGERHVDGARRGINPPMMSVRVTSRRRRVPHSRPEVVECFQDIGVTSEQARNQYSEEGDTERQDENQSDHCVSFASGERRELYRPGPPDHGTPPSTACRSTSCCRWCSTTLPTGSRCDRYVTPICRTA